KSRYSYDDTGSLEKEERYLDANDKWLATQFAYDTYGNAFTVTDALGRTTTTTYDSTKTFPASVKNALDHSQAFTYDYATGKIITSTDPNGQITTSIYDGFGRLTKVTGPGGISEVSYAYDLTSNPVMVSTTTKISDTDTITSHSWADGLGRTIETITEADDGKYILSGIVKYDSRGQVIEKYLPTYVTAPNYVAPTYDGKHITYVYDPLGRVTQTIRPDNKVSQNIYAITTVETINVNAQRKRITKDAYGRIVTVEEFNGGEIYTTTYEYDVLGNLIKTIDTLNNITTIKYDSLGRKIDMNCPSMGYWQYSYDDVGNLKTQTDNKGEAIIFDYDDINRLKSKSTGVTYTYDQNTNGKGRLSKVEDLSGITEFFYDILGREERTVKIIDGRSYSIERKYDSLDRLTSVTYPDTVVVKYEYNKQGGIKKVYSPGTGGDVVYVQDTKYNANGQIEEITYGNGRKTTYNYDLNNLRLERLLTANTAGSDPVQDLSYIFDPVGNVKQITDVVNSNTQSFSYDDLNRLTSAIGPHYGTQTYKYNAIGNMTEKDGKTLVYGENGAGPHAVTKYGDTVITYDANGNMEAKGNAQYSYDIENRLTEVAIPRGGEVSSHTYEFSAGWNYFSVPYKMIDQNGTLTAIESIPIGVLLLDINGKYDQISKYDESIDDPNTGHWQHYVGNSKFDQYSYFAYGDGYLIYINTACSLSLTGSTPSSAQTKILNAGWTLTLGPTNTSIAVQDALEGVSYDSVKVYNGSTYDDATMLEAGEAYWIQTTSTQTWNIQPKQDLTEFVYDGDGGRTKRIFEDRTTIYIGSSYEIQIDNTTQDVIKYKKFIHMGSSRVCEVEQIGDDIHAYFVHANHISSSNILTDETGSRVSLFEYKPFGSVAYADEDNTYDTDKRFTGKTYDKTTGLHYYGARYYDSQLGRFITADPTIQHPYDPQDFSRYAYCRNNPLKYTDPTGLGWWSSFWKALVGGIVAGVVLALTGGAGAIPIVAYMAAGIAGGITTGALEGGLGGALIGAALGAFGGYGYAVGGVGFAVGMLAIGAGLATATGGLEGLGDYAAGFYGGAMGGMIGSGVGNAMRTVLSAQPKAGPIEQAVPEASSGNANEKPDGESKNALNIDKSDNLKTESDSIILKESFEKAPTGQTKTEERKLLNVKNIMNFMAEGITNLPEPYDYEVQVLDEWATYKVVTQFNIKSGASELILRTKVHGSEYWVVRNIYKTTRYELFGIGVKVPEVYKQLTGEKPIL
ncbi:MAG: RHS repeat-associated core domain-containing protein, partial [Candidatus Omnitrophica bacterium]|nr:RHS repeat-associated core domain-containing protein [Candidatus Omnitrophota bacterium]